MSRFVACKACPTCDAGYAGKPSNWLTGTKCANCGHVRCPKNPSPPTDDEPSNVEAPHKKPVLTTGGQQA